MASLRLQRLGLSTCDLLNEASRLRGYDASHHPVAYWHLPGCELDIIIHQENCSAESGLTGPRQRTSTTDKLRYVEASLCSLLYAWSAKLPSHGHRQHTIYLAHGGSELGSWWSELEQKPTTVEDLEKLQVEMETKDPT